jgi:ferredoxin, 2Fe-2S
MSFKRSDRVHGPPVVPVTFVLDDPDSVSTTAAAVQKFMGATGMSLLELAMDNGINIEHACGGVCACSTCHVYVEEGMGLLSEAQEAEEDRVEEAPGLQRNSRLACQCIIEGAGPIRVRVPAWNRNAVKEVPH